MIETSYREKTGCETEKSHYKCHGLRILRIKNAE